MYEEKSIGAAFTAQLDDLEHQYPEASNLLKMISFFDPESIPLDMITPGAESLSRLLVPSTATSSNGVASGKVLKPLLRLVLSPIQFQGAITQLRNRSLVKHIYSADTSVLRIHDLIKIMVQSRLTNSGADREWFEIAVELACGAFQHVEDPESYTCWPRCAMFAPHFQLLTTQDGMYGNRSILIMKANWRIAIYLKSSGP
jgi:hypothetical protein